MLGMDEATVGSLEAREACGRTGEWKWGGVCCWVGVDTGGEMVMPCVGVIEQRTYKYC